MKVIVYTCVYNGEKTLAHTIESVLQQTCDSFEYHIEDNGSTDGTRAIICGYADRDSRIVPHIREKNHTQTGEPSPVLTFVPPKSDYFTNIDGDDWWEPDYLERLLAFAERFHLDIACTGTRMHDMATGGEGTRQLPRPLVLEKTQFAEGFPYYHAFLRPIWGKMIRTELVPLIRLPDAESLYFYGADTFYSFQLLRHANRIGVDSSVLHHYRIDRKSVSGRYNPGRFESDVYLYNDAVDFLSAFGPLSPQNRQFLQAVYANALTDTTGVIENSTLAPADKLREYNVIALHPVTRAAYQQGNDESVTRSRTNLICRTLKAGTALGTVGDDRNLRQTMQLLLPCCGQSVFSANAQMFLESSELLQALLRDDENAVMENLLSRIKKNQEVKKYAIPETLQALAVNHPLLCQIDDAAFLRSYSEIYRLVWQGNNMDALDQMSGLLFDNQVNGSRETFLKLFIALAALENHAPAFVFGKLRLAELYLQQNRRDECRAVVKELGEMGVEDGDLGALERKLVHKE